MRIPKFKPIYLNGQNARPWAVNIPPYLSPTGKTQRRFFLTIREARAFADHMKRQYEDHDYSATYLSRDRLQEAAKAYNALHGLTETTGKTYTLLGVVEEFVKREREASASVSLETLFDQYLEARANREPRYLDQQRWAKTRFPRLSVKIVSKITPADIESALRRETPSNRNSFLRYIRAVLNWGIKRGYLTANPVSQVEFTEIRRKEVQVYSPDEVARLLQDCLENDLNLVPYRVLTILCGVRPRGEATRVEWADLNWQDKVLKLRSAVTKKHRTRFIYVSDNAMAWLSEYKRLGGSTEGLMVGYTRNQLEVRYRANHRRTEVKSKKNAGRHSYCSYHLAKYNDINSLTLQSGHASADILWRCYYQCVTKEDAERYWSIVPKAALTNVVAFQG